MTVNKPKKDDIGTMILLEMQESMATAIEHSGESGNGIVFKVIKSSGAVVTWTNCSIFEEQLRYITVAGDLNEASGDYDNVPYKITPKFGMGGWEGHGDTVEVYVYDTEETPG